MKRSLSGMLSAPFALLVLVVAACSGHGSSSVPAAPRASGATAAAREYGVRVRLLIPRKPASTSRRRKRQYVSSSTQSGEVIVNGGLPVPFAVSSSSPNCSFNEGGGTCTVTVDAPAGDDSFTMETFDGGLDGNGNPTGNLLSTGTADQPITAATANAVNLTLDGVVSSLSINAQPNTAPVGTPTSIPVFVNANDADGNTIVGPGSYVDGNGNPITIAVSDADGSGATSISNSSVTAPTDPVPTLVYGGGELHGTVPTLTASAPGEGSVTTTVAFTPGLGVTMSALQASPSSMTAGADGNIYLLEPGPVPSSNNVNANVEQYIVGGSGSDAIYSYTGCTGGGVLSLNPGIVAVTDGRMYIATDDDCGQTQTAEIVGMTPGGAFSATAIGDNRSSDIVLGSLALGYPGSGTNVQLVAVVTPAPSASGTIRRMASAPSASPSSGPSFVTSSTSGSATSYAFASMLGLTAGDNYTFADVPGANAITYDPNGNAWFPETIVDTTTGTTSYVIVHANATTAGSYQIPQSGGVETIVAVTTGSDGNIWYVGNRQTSGAQTIVVGNVTPGGTFTEYSIATNSPAMPVSTAIVEGADAALYTLVAGNIIRVTHDGTITSMAPGVPLLGGNVTTGLKMSGGDIYFTGTGSASKPALYQLLY